FDLGGHSLLATQLVSRIRDRFRAELPLKALFDHPTVAGLAILLRQESNEASEAIAPQTGFTTPSFAQQRMLFLERFGAAGTAYLIPLALRLRGPLDVASLRAALGELVTRHQALRTVFPDDDEPRVQLLPPTQFDLGLRRCSDAELKATLLAEATRPFRLQDEPPFRAALLQLGDDDHVLSLTLHHIAADGWSVAILGDELRALYAAHRCGRRPELPEPRVQYADYAAWQTGWMQSDESVRAMQYWRDTLAGAPCRLALPLDRKRPRLQTYQGATAHFTLGTETTDALRHLAREAGTTLHAVLLAGYAALLARLGDCDELVIGTAVANRTRSETERTIGLFVNSLPIRCDLRGAPDAPTLSARLQAAMLAAQAHQELPFERIVDAVQPPRSLARHAIFQTMFTLVEDPLSGMELDGLAVEPVAVELTSAKLDLLLSMAETPDGLRGELQYNRDLFEASTASRMVAMLARLLAAMPVDLHAIDLGDHLEVRPALDADDAPPLAAAAVAARDEDEIGLAALWAELLGRARIGVDDDFFALGGHSLLALKLAARLRQQLGRAVPVQLLFEYPTVRGFAAALRAGEAAEGPPPIAPHEGVPVLSFAQQRLWFLDQLGGSVAYNMPGAYRIGGALDVGALQAAFDALVARHAVLRTTYPRRDGSPSVQVEAPRAMALALRACREDEIRTLADEDALRPFDLAQDWPIRAVLLRVTPTHHVLLLTLHHIAGDGWSVELLLRELADLYRGDALPPLKVQYADYAAWQRGWLTSARTEPQLDYWRKALAGLPPSLDLPTDRARPRLQRHHGATHRFTIPAPLTARLRALGQAHDATLFMTLLAGYGALLSRYAGQDDFAIGTPMANRSDVTLEGLIGFFTNTLTLRADLSGDPDTATLLRRTRQRTLDGFAHQDVPFEQIVDALQPERSLQHAPLFQTMFTLQDTEWPSLQLDGLEVASFDLPTATATFDLNLSIWVERDALTALIHYDTDLFDAVTIARLARHFCTLLDVMAAQPSRPVASLPLLTETELQEFERWNATATPYPQATIHELVAQQAARTPAAIAIEHGDVRIDYAALERGANAIAAQLAAACVRSGDLVGLRLERGALLIQSMLAILKTGAAYLPLDAAYPAQRIAAMVEDSGIRVVLTDRPTALPGALTRLMPDPHATAGFVAATEAPRAYVMYTSGSTGTPKGIAIPHRGVVRLVCNTDYVQLDHARIAHVSNTSFDAATFEIWGALIHGGTVVVFERDETLAPAIFAAALAQRRIDAMFITTALFNQMAREAPGCFAPVGDVLFGGEAVDPGAVRSVLAQGAPKRLLHVYGPTESTTFATWHLIEQVDAEARTVPIGRPVANTTAHILDAQRLPVPLGVAGDLWLGGDGLAEGYWKRADLTAERFVEIAGERLYFTGDRARRLVDGSIEYLARSDDQVKLRGFRIELGEIEAVLAAQPGIAACAVLAREDVPGDKRLVAYIVGDASDDALRSGLRVALPDYMVPAQFVRLDALPITPNGKVDRRALPAPSAEAAVADAHVAPRDGTEQQLAEIWSELLQRTPIGVHDNFFDLGGHSLLATQLVSRIRDRFRAELPLKTLFEQPTIAQLAPLLLQDSAARPALPGIRARARTPHRITP
ncbi:MAG: non-ribosomal peptide synthetase module, partial [Rhodospirillales bacterium]|nr:non-ribosomal peptide synthetase module [Rhodospirillales bacterium]